MGPPEGGEHRDGGMNISPRVLTCVTMRIVVDTEIGGKLRDQCFGGDYLVTFGRHGF